MNDEWRTWKFAGVYALVHIDTQKVYVGQAQNIARRFLDHIYTKKKDTRICRAIIKHGWDAFDKILLKRVDDLEILDAEEQYWIDKFQACDKSKGYNICPVAGSTRGYKHSPETLAKLSIASKGKPCSESAKAKISLFNAGKRLTAEHKAKIGKAHLGKPKSEEERTRMRLFVKAKFSTQEGRDKQSAIYRKAHHTEERTVAVTAYLTEHPDTSLSEMERAIGIPMSSASRFAHAMGWHKQNGYWQRTNLEENHV